MLKKFSKGMLSVLCILSLSLFGSNTVEAMSPVSGTETIECVRSTNTDFCLLNFNVASDGRADVEVNIREKRCVGRNGENI